MKYFYKMMGSLQLARECMICSGWGDKLQNALRMCCITRGEYPILNTRISFRPSLSDKGYLPWLLKRAGLTSYGVIASSEYCETKRIAFFPHQFFSFFLLLLVNNFSARFSSNFIEVEFKKRFCWKVFFNYMFWLNQFCSCLVVKCFG